MLFRMFSTLVAVREVQLFQALPKQLLPGVPVQSLKKFSGKSVMLLQASQALEKPVASTGLLPAGKDGNDVRLLQFCQVLPKFVPDDMSISGNDSKLVQLNQVDKKFVPLDVLIGGNDVMLLQLFQVREKFIPFDVSINGKLYCSPNSVMLSKLVQLYQVLVKIVAFDVSMSGNDLRLEQPNQAL